MIPGLPRSHLRGCIPWRKPQGLPSDLVKIARRKLGYLDAAVDLRDLRRPSGNRLEALKGDRQGQHSIRINDQSRICFR